MSYRCLLVDDNEQFRQSAQRLLRREGVDVVAVASTGAEALAAAAAADVDVSLVDVNLADGEDGTAVADALAARGLGGRILLVSTLDADDVAELVDVSAAVGFVPKAQLGLDAIEAALN